MNKFIKVSLLTAAMTGMLLNPVAAFAQTDVSVTPGVESNIRNFTLLQKRIEERVIRYRKNRDDYQARYQRIVDRSQRLVDMLKEKGYDPTLVAKLETDLKTLRDKIADFSSDADAAFKKLEEANDYNCGTSEGQFKTLLAEAKELFKVVRADASAIKDYINNTIKPDIKALKDSRPTPTLSEPEAL